MKNVLLQATMKLNRNRKQKKWWQRVVRVMTTVVVFSTTYALILPAITMEGETVCGFEAHAHSESCYVQHPIYDFQCGLDEQVKVVHSHDAFCSNVQGELICLLPEINEHTHQDGCYAHTQTETLICEYVHTHSEGCYDDAQSLICELTTNDEHVHEEACYEQQLTLMCNMEEVVPHTHEESCYDGAGALLCQLPQAVAHNHGEDCQVESGEMLQILTCELPEHTHEDACYPLKESEEEASEYLCSSGVHTHVEGCYDAEGALVCTIPEHIHEAACLVADLDLTADVETQQQWEEDFAQLSLTGNWPRDVLTVAKTQLGYQESEKNVILEDGEFKGYTRYGEWYGIPYGDWCAMYVSFCLNYAGVEDFPLEAQVDCWINALTEAELYFTPNVYNAKPGDVIFFDYDQKKDPVEEIPVDADHVGLVVELIPATETEPAQIKTIEGNTGDQVAYMTYELDDPAIIGYGRMPVGEKLILEYQGEDYSVTVSCGKDANIPDTAQLAVREIEAGTEEYDTYYQQSVRTLFGQSTAETEEDLNVSFARFFDIGFVVDGAVVEPAAPVDIQIRYDEGFEMAEEDTGLVVHFAEERIEIIDANTYDSGTEQTDTFEFTQDSFSVSGTIVTFDLVRAVNAYYYTEPTGLDTAGSVQYLIYTEYDGKYYAIQSTREPGNANGAGIVTPVEITFNEDGSIATNVTNNMLWTLTLDGSNSYIIRNVGSEKYLHSFDNANGENITTNGAYATSMIASNGGGNYGVIFRSNSDYAQFDGEDFTVGQSEAVATTFYLATMPGSQSTYHVWFDGTNGGLMNLYGASDTYRGVPANNNVINLPTADEVTPPSKYPYKLNGWYDINNHQYYAPGAQVTIAQNTVFYADWIAESYDVGRDTEDTVDSLDTNDFITTYVFDYNTLFNVQSLAHTGNISATDHSETWSIMNSGKVPYNNQDTLNFMFVDYDADGDFSYALGRDDDNINQGDDITEGILGRVSATSGGKDLLDVLFNPGTSVIGKSYIGTGNYLFQYMDSTTENYDGIHDGYYYLDARLNAASYYQSDDPENSRFYLYDYLERTSDSNKDGGVGQYSDFLPFNSPYLFEEDQLDAYNDSIRRPGYEYDAKEGGSNYPEYNSLDDAITNYFFGIRSDIEFFLPNNTNTQDEYGNYGNISTRGEHMIFDFHGDDDVWVFVDGQLLLDIGGLHGVMFGQIDFSTGTITVGKDGGVTESSSFSLSEGTHTMTVYYMERGSSQSNCAIYFNIAPRYDLEITKEDIVSAEKLDGAVFAIYNDEAMTDPAELWTSYEAHENGEEHTNSFTVVDGVAKCWGISAGKTYYIREITPPPGYPASDDMIRITLNNRGTATIETTTLHGPNGVATEGFAVIKQEINETLKIVALTVTNQKEGDHTEVRVEKTWAEGSENLPQSITVYLTADGVPVGRRAVLNEGNGWSYTWTGLDKYRAEGIDEEIVYEVQEVLVPGFITTQGATEKVVDYVDWIRVDQMSDSKTFLLVHNGQALTYNGSSFGWMAPATAELDSSLSAQWKVTTDHDGFHLKNGLGYTLTYRSTGFYGVDNDTVALNQVFYYLNSRLVVHDHDVYYQFGANGSVVSEDGLAFTLYQKEVMTGFLTNIINVPVEEEDQTFVEVNKIWADGNENHADGAVIIRLYADGKDTGRYVTLDAANNWSGGFYDLPYFQEDGETEVVYTVVEDEVNNYLPQYSEAETLNGLPVTLWQEATGLSSGDIYRFTSGSYALAVDSENNVVSVASDLDDPDQQWEAVSYNGGIVLQNVGSERYLDLNNNNLTTAANQSSATAVTMTNGYVMLGRRYLEVGAGYAGTTNSSANITNQNVYVQVMTSGRPGTGYTVTNLPGIYELPMTGGMGTYSLAFGGLLILAAALMFLCKFGRKQQKGGRHH